MRLKTVVGGNWRILAVCRRRGDCSFQDFLNGLPANLQKDKTRLLALLGFVKEHGPPRNTEKCHKISEDIWEFIAGRLRVLWFYDSGKVVVVSHGFVKKRQKTPKREIQTAERHYKTYQRAKDSGDLRFESQTHEKQEL